MAGLGRIGRVHAVNLATRVPGAYLAGVADPSPGALKECEELFEVPCSQSFEELIDDPRIHAVVIATPAPTHPEMVSLAAARGKHILCEKPLALDIAKGEEAFTAAKEARVLLQVGFHRRFDRDFMIAKSQIDEGSVGEVFTFFDSMRDMQPPPPESVQGAGQALLHDAACHDLDAARWMVGEINEIRTFGASLASEELKRVGQIDHALTFLRFENGALGTIDNSLSSGYGFDCRCEITGSKATLRIDSPHLAEVEWLSRGRGGFARTPSFLDRFAHAYPRELKSFVKAVEGRSELAVSGEDGLAAVVLATAAERSVEIDQSVHLRRRHVDGSLRYEMEENKN